MLTGDREDDNHGARVTRWWVVAGGLAVFVAVPRWSTPRARRLRDCGGAHPRPGNDLAGNDCPMFPANNVWNTNISRLPVAPQSPEWLAAIDGGDPGIDLHPDFGPGGGPVPRTESPSRSRRQISRSSTSGSSTQARVILVHTHSVRRRRSRAARVQPATATRSMVDPKTCVLYELYDAYFRPGGKSTAGSGAIWQLDSNRLRPATWTSADAAGLPMLPGLVNYDEVMSGHLDHAIRFTAPVTDDTFIWPARHEASSENNPDLPPMGARFRLRASFHLPPAGVRDRARRSSPR